VERIDDRALLEDIGRRDENASVREAALRRIERLR
jgi:hypothetical protein